MVLGMDTYRITVAVRKRSDLEAPASLDEALAIVRNLLEQGSFLTVLAVEPEATKSGQVKWG